MKRPSFRTTNRGRSDKVAKVITLSISILFWVLFIGVIAFIIYGSIPGWKRFGFADIFFTATYNLEQGKAGVWLPLCVTLLVSGFALLLGGPIGVKTAMFIRFRIPKSKIRYVKMVVELLADIPAVVFGLFTVTIFAPFLQWLFHLPSALNLLTCGFMLAFMIMPTVVSMTLSALDSVDESFLLLPISLGNTKTQAMYKVYKKQIRGKIVIALITAISRAIGETMAVSMILQSQNFNEVFSHGFGNVWMSYLKTLGGLIASNMFAEASSASLKGLLFIYGFFLLIVVVVMNGVVKFLFKQKKTTKQNKFIYGLGVGIKFIPRQFVKLWNLILNGRSVVRINYRNVDEQLPLYFRQRAFKEKANSKIYDGWKLFWEILCFSLTVAFSACMFIVLVVRGVMAIGPGKSTIFQFGKDTTGQAFVNTILMMIVSVGIGFIIALAVAIYINEFCKEGKWKKGFLFFIDSLGATPSIIYGMFGMIFFLQILGLSSAGRSGKSLLACSLTLIFVILPAFTRQIIGALQTIPQETRQASYALGVGKWQTISKIVLPAAFQHILTSVVLSIGRILAETAPIYLTAGVSGGSQISYMSPGQTLTTRIYAQLGSNDIVKARRIMYECAFIILILIILILLVVDVLIPMAFDKKRAKAANTPIEILGDKKKLKAFKKIERKKQVARFKNNMMMFYNLNFR